MAGSGRLYMGMRKTNGTPVGALWPVFEQSFITIGKPVVPKYNQKVMVAE
jgi:hypothetical protein